MQLTWINFLHFYQPANADAYIIKEAAESSYQRIIKALIERPHIRFTANISGCLLERLADMGYLDLINDMKDLVVSGQLELAGSAAYHPLLPLIPEAEAKLQIQENEEILKRYFGSGLKLAGFFLPEMAFSPAVGKVIKSCGYEWIILDEISRADENDKGGDNGFFRDSGSGLGVIFRSRELSSCYVPDKLLSLISSDSVFTAPAITATDAELYGLRHQDPTAEFEKLLDQPGLLTATISEHIVRSSGCSPVQLRSSSWDSTEAELKAGEPFHLWSSRSNQIQDELWKLAKLAWTTSKKFRSDGNSYWSRWHLVRGLASCSFWWASGKDFHRIFGPLSWNPDQVELGVNELVRSIRALDDPSTRKIKVRAENMAIKIKKMVWRKHWEKYWKA